MQFPVFVTTDLHLTDSPSCAYRWGLFDWMYDLCKKHKVKTLLILGDLTDAKDKHSAELVNKVVKTISACPVDDVRILAGNHDWLKKGQEFFKFLNYLPNVKFITEPTFDHDGGKDGDEFYASAAFMPYSKTPATDWKILLQEKYPPQYVFMHQTVKGAIASNGQVMEGEETLPLDKLAKTVKVYSGDIHVPQVLGRVEYIGSPYHVHFGDNFKPRCILLIGPGKSKEFHFETVKRVSVTVEDLKSLKRFAEKSLAKGDHIKVRMQLSQAERHDWMRIKREAIKYLETFGAEVHGVELLLQRTVPLSMIEDLDSWTSAKIGTVPALTRFAETEELPADVLDVGLDIVGGE